MSTAKRKISVTVEIEYSVVNNKFGLTEKEQDETAISLAVDPRFSNIENGIQLETVEVIRPEDTNPE